MHPPEPRGAAWLIYSHSALRRRAHPVRQPPPRAGRARLGLQPLLTGRELAGLPGGQDARRVGVPAPAAVALREHQHVLRERRQVAAAHRAAVGRGLQVRGPADVPPARLRRLSHASKHGTGGGGGRVSSGFVEHRDERIVVETGRYRITGLLRLPRDGYRSRLTDYLNASERGFVPLTDVELEPLDGTGVPERCPFLALSVGHIVLAMPAVAEQPAE